MFLPETLKERENGRKRAERERDTQRERHREREIERKTVVLICCTCPAITVVAAILRALDRVRERALGCFARSPKSPQKRSRKREREKDAVAQWMN